MVELIYMFLEILKMEERKEKIIMSKDNKTITINNKEYEIDKLDANQVKLINQVQDLDNKIQKSKFNLVQLEGGRKYFFDELVKLLNE